MKINWQVFKKGKPIYWIIGAIVLFVIFYLLASGGSKSSGSSSGGVTTVNTGPSDAQVAAGAQVQMAQLQAQAAVNAASANLAAEQTQANAAVAVATLQAQNDALATTIGGDVAKYTANLDATVQQSAITAQMQAIQTQAEYSFATAKTAAETNIAIQQINANVFANQLEANNEALRIQSKNLVDQTLIAQIPSLKKKNRDDVLLALTQKVA